MGMSCAVLGASGYSGAELVRLLLGHPALELAAVAGSSSVGRPVAEVLPHVESNLTVVSVAEALGAGAELYFSCLPSGALEEWEGRLPPETFVDLSDDFRADPEWVYGLTEFARRAISGATRIANPGCYPTATLLCLVPFLRAGLVEGPAVVDALSGVSGAGRRAEDRLTFGTINENASAYGTTMHRHVPEMERGCELFGGSNLTLSFTPHLIPMTRGLLVTARVRLLDALDDATALQVLHDAYEGEAFVRVTEQWPATKTVAGGNGAVVSARVDERNGWLIASAAIDNLGKGAAGQAIQNANVALGIEESAGLTAMGVWP